MDQTQIAQIAGYSAATIGIITFVPQAYQCWKTKDTKAISLTSYTLLALASFLWVVYGSAPFAIPVVVVNTIIFFLSIFILILKKKYG